MGEKKRTDSVLKRNVAVQSSEDSAVQRGDNVETRKKHNEQHADGSEREASGKGEFAVIRMSPNDEKLALNEGHFLNRLREAGVIDGEGNVTEAGHQYVERMNATYIHLTINKMLSMNKRYQTVLAVIRDVGNYIGAVNLATAMHRLGRLVRKARVANPSVLDKVIRHPQYKVLLKKTEETIDVMEPRALANFLWGMAALGDQVNTGIILRLGERLMQIDTNDLKTQEISNVVWSLATLEMQMPDLLNRMLEAVGDIILFGFSCNASCAHVSSALTI